jgi:hypothetical protein
MNDKHVATIRTTVPAVWVALLSWLIVSAGWTPSEQGWQAILLTAPIVLGVFYRAGRELEQRWPIVGRILFGSQMTPRYEANDG